MNGPKTDLARVVCIIFGRYIDTMSMVKISGQNIP